MAVSLAIIIVCIWVVALLLRRLLPQARHAGRGGVVTVLHRLYLGPKQSVVLIKVAGRILIVGVSGQQMTVLSEIADAFDVADVVARLDGVAKPDAEAAPALDARALERLETDALALVDKLRQLKGDAGEGVA